MTRDLGAAGALYRAALDGRPAVGDLDLELCSLSGLGEKLVMPGDVEIRDCRLVDEAMAGALGGECSRLDTVVFTSCDMLVACDLATDLERATRWCQVADRFIQDTDARSCTPGAGPSTVACSSTTGHWADGRAGAAGRRSR